MKISPQDQKSPVKSISFDFENFAELQAIVMFVSNEKVELKEMERINLVSAEQLVNLCAPYLVSEYYKESRQFLWKL